MLSLVVVGCCSSLLADGCRCLLLVLAVADCFCVLLVDVDVC